MKTPFSTFASKVTVLVLVILALLSIVVGVVSYQVTRSELTRTALEGLQALATARKQAIEGVLDRYLDTIKTFAQPDLEVEFEAMLKADTADRPRLMNELRERMRRELAVRAHGVGAQIVDLEGAVVVQTGSGQDSYAADHPRLVEVGRLRPHISAPHAEGEDFRIELAAPLHDSRNNTVAVLILLLDATELLDITGDRTGLGTSGETVLGQRRGDFIHFLVPLLYAPNLAEFEPLPTTAGRARPMLSATAGQMTEFSEAPDYRGETVVAVSRRIEPAGWGLVVKQDRSEVFGGVGRLRGAIYLVVLGVLALAALVVVPVARNFTSPLRMLQQATERVAAGDLTVEVPSGQADEVGKLAASFNTMVERLEASQEELKRSNRELSSFAYVVSHDLRAPLRGIESLSQWLEKDLAERLSEEEREQMALLRQRVRRMDELISGLLEYSRVGRVQHPDVRVPVEELLSRVIDALDPPEHVHVSIREPMPTLDTDELRLSQVFQNLIENAIKYHPGPTASIEVGCRDTGAAWEFSVTDDGAGIEPRFHERIFELFQSLHAADETESTGVGLALVKRIVEGKGGSVWVESTGNPGEGATFRFTWLKS